MPTFIKTGYWESAVKSYKGWLNLNDLFIENSGSVSPGQVAFYNSNNSITGSNKLVWDNINNRLAIGSAPLTADFEINKNSAVIQAYRNSNNGVNLSTGASVYQLDILGRRNGADATFARMQVFYNGNGITRRGKLLFGVAESSGFGGSSFMLSQTSGNVKVVNLGNNSAAYLDNDTTITTAYAQHAQVVVAATTSLPLMSWDISGVVSNIMMQNGNLLLNTTSDTGEKLQVTGNAKITGSLDLFSVTSAGAGSDYFYLDNDPNLSAGANNQTIALMRLRDRGSNGAFTGVNRLGIIMENTAGGQFPFQLFSDTGNLRIGYSTVASTTTRLSLRGGTNDNSARTLDIENASGSPLLRVYNGVQVLVGSSTPAASTILQADSTTQGFLPPRMTTAQKNAIVTPPAGLIVYDTGLNKLCVFTTGWQTITSA